jgi:hypothetical protein
VYALAGDIERQMVSQGIGENRATGAKKYVEMD